MVYFVALTDIDGCAGTSPAITHAFCEGLGPHSYAPKSPEAGLMGWFGLPRASPRSPGQALGLAYLEKRGRLNMARTRCRKLTGHGSPVSPWLHLRLSEYLMR